MLLSTTWKVGDGVWRGCLLIFSGSQGGRLFEVGAYSKVGLIPINMVSVKLMVKPVIT